MKKTTQVGKESDRNEEEYKPSSDPTLNLHEEQALRHQASSPDILSWSESNGC